MEETYLVQNKGGKSNPFAAVLIGILMFLGSFVLIYKNEGRINLALFAEKAPLVTPGESYTEGQLLAITGPVTTTELTGDGLFKKPERYVSLKREVQMYAWKEEKRDKDNGTEYSYSKEWTSSPDDSSRFEIKAGHENPELLFRSEVFTPNNLTIGTLGLNGKTVSLPSHDVNIILTKSNTDLVTKYGKPLLVKDGAEIYINAKSSTEEEAGIQDPAIGDIRVTYYSIPVNAQVTAFGAYHKNGEVQTLGEYTASQSLKSSTTFYHMRYGDKSAATQTLGDEFKLMLWVLRGVGFLLMLIGFNMILSPIKKLLGYIPIVGQIGNFALGAISFVVVLVLYAVTLLVAIVAHNPIVLAVAAVLVIGVGALIAKKFATKKTDSIPV